jgi:hypothetical protein
MSQPFTDALNLYRGEVAHVKPQSGDWIEITSIFTDEEISASIEKDDVLVENITLNKNLGSIYLKDNATLLLKAITSDFEDPQSVVITGLKPESKEDEFEVDQGDGNSSDTNSTVINITQAQGQSQKQSQRLSIGEINRNIEQQDIREYSKEELRKLIREYEEELSKEEPDASKLRSIVKKSKDYSSDIARQLGILALEHGFEAILG